MSFKRKIVGDYKTYNNNASKFYKPNYKSGTILPPTPNELESELKLKNNEDTLGITYYIRNGIPFTGIFKARYTDFIVREINRDNQVVQLTSTAIPEFAKEKAVEVAQEESKSKFPEGMKKLKELTSPEIASGFETWFNNEDEKFKRANPYFFTDSFEKDQRRLIHELIRESFPACNSSCENKVFFISYRKDGVKLSVRERRYKQRTIQFTLFKTNKDTTQALSQLAFKLYLKPSNFAFAGTKDKRACTTQTATVWGATVQNLIRFSQPPGLILGDFKEVDSSIRLGELNGNEFEITPIDNLTSAMNSIINNGFINYFGLQRFGNSSISTHRIGRALLKGEYTLAMYLILAPREGEKEEIDFVRKKLFTSRDVDQALLEFPSFMNAERCILQQLVKDRNDILGAVQNLPNKLISLYLHAFQSFIWNNMASLRLKHSLAPIVGDMVFAQKDIQETMDEDEFGDISDENPNYNEHSVLPSKETKNRTLQLPEVSFISEEDIANNKYKMSDIILPLPGIDIQYPSNFMKAEYEKLLELEGVPIAQLINAAKTKALSCHGAYRRMIAMPKDIEWKLKNYNDPETELAITDADKLNGVKEAPVTDGPHTALMLKFKLGPSCYATMLLRELLMQSTEKSLQQELLNAHSKSPKIESNEPVTGIPQAQKLIRFKL